MASPVVQPSCLCRGGSIVEHKRWYDLSYEEAKDLAMEAKAFRARPNVGPGPFPGPAHGRPSEVGSGVQMGQDPRGVAVQLDVQWARVGHQTARTSDFVMSVITKIRQILLAQSSVRLPNSH